AQQPRVIPVRSPQRELTRHSSRAPRSSAPPRAGSSTRPRTAAPTRPAIPPPARRGGPTPAKPATERALSGIRAGSARAARELREYSRPRGVRTVPPGKPLQGGHRFVLTPEGDATRAGHELEMRPTGILRPLAPMTGVTGRKNPPDTANAPQ